MKVAMQGVRQKGHPKTASTSILKQGEVFISMRFPNKPEEFTVPEGCVGIVHKEDKEVSIVRDDCQAVRRAVAKVKKD